MYTEEELRKLGIEEDELTEEELLLLLAALHGALSNLEREIRLFYQKYGKDGIVTYAEARKWVSAKNHTKRLVVLNETISSLFEASFVNFEKDFRNHLTNEITKEIKYFKVDVDIDDILNTVWGEDGANWLQRLTAHRNKWVTTINSDLKVSFLKRDSVIDVISNLAKRGETMDVILKRLWRTETNAISSITRKEIYKKLGIKNYRFIHVDKCHCEKCTDMDNVIFPLSEYIVGITANPLHPNCKDRTVPIWD